MKKLLFSLFTKTSLLSFLFAAAFTQTKAQTGDADPAINILTPTTLALGDTGAVLVQISNIGQTTDIVSNSLEITVSLGSNATIVGIIPDSSNPGWTQYSLTSGTGNTIKMHNTAGGLAVFDIQNVYLKIVATVVSPTPGQISAARIAYFVGSNPALGGKQNISQGNTQTSNDNSASSLIVSAGPLPVVLQNFTAKAQDCNALVTWKTGSESLMDHYTIEAGTDGQHFTAMDQVPAKNVAGSEYGVIVPQHNAMTMYRLMMVAHDGKKSYSQVQVVRTNCNSISSSSLVTVSPNPTQGPATIDGVREGQQVLVRDMLGHQLGVYAVTGAHITIDLSDFAAGTYSASIVDAANNLVQTVKIVKSN